MGCRSQSYGASPAIWDHSVTCHSTQVNAPCLNPSQIGWNSICLPWRDGRLSWPRRVVTYRDGFTCPQAVTHRSTNPARRRVTSLIKSNSLPLSHATNPSAISYFFYCTVSSVASCRDVSIFFCSQLSRRQVFSKRKWKLDLKWQKNYKQTKAISLNLLSHPVSHVVTNNNHATVCQHFPQAQNNYYKKNAFTPGINII